MVGFQPHDEIQFCHERPFVTLFNSQKTDQVFYGVALYLKWKRLVLVVVNLEFFSANELLEYALKSFLKCSC